MAGSFEVWLYYMNNQSPSSPDRHELNKTRQMKIFQMMLENLFQCNLLAMCCCCYYADYIFDDRRVQTRNINFRSLFRWANSNPQLVCLCERAHKRTHTSFSYHVSRADISHTKFFKSNTVFYRLYLLLFTTSRYSVYLLSTYRVGTLSTSSGYLLGIATPSSFYYK